MFHNWWLLVIPLAVSQITVFWTVATQQFAPALPAATVEMVSPLLAGFLCAHLLAAEYRSGVGAVLASKPVHIGRVVLLRLGVALAFVWALGGLSLLVFTFGMEPYSLAAPALALVISSLFLALLALTFATLFRHPLAGFGVAACWWLLDLPPGPPINPYLSLKSLASSFPSFPVALVSDNALTKAWWAAKLLLLLGALALYLLHGRLLFTLGSPLTLRRKRRAVAGAVGLLLVYLVSGAVVKVGYAYQHRGKLYPSDAAWVRRQFGPYGPLPVAALFGPTFKAYVGSIPNSWRLTQAQEGEADLLGDTLQHRRDLDRVLKAYPDSIWAPSALELRARLGLWSHTPPETRVGYYRILAERHPNSPYTASALFQIGRVYEEAAETDPAYGKKAREAFEAFLALYPNSDDSADALRFLTLDARRRGDKAAAGNYARRWITAAPPHEKFMACLTLAELRQEEGDREETRKAAQQRALTISEPRRVRAKQAAVDALLKAKAYLQ
jgi:tetratricopeptide (TPR) repeat protein